MEQPSAVYANGQARIKAFVEALDRGQLDTKVPACPEWTVKELVAHVTGVASDSLAANIEELGKPGWTQAQVDARKDKPLSEILDEWDSITQQVGPALDALHPTISSALIGDLITHEHDLRGALGNNEARDDDGVVISASFYARNFGKRLKDAGLPTVTVEGGENQWVAGREEPIGSVRAPLFDMLRGLTGRRTTDEVKGFDWSIDAAPYLEVFSMYPVTDRSLNE
jgi:uncharacterized protein (TIGR03083 family)